MKHAKTGVYVTNLPLDTKVDGLAYMRNDQGRRRRTQIKMYAREDGSFSGDALVVFFKEDLVTFAVNLMDEAELRLGNASTRIKFQRAEFGHKQQQGVGGQGGGGGERKVVDRKKATRRIGKMQRYAPRMVSC